LIDVLKEIMRRDVHNLGLFPSTSLV
jgi:hypothetical protein